MPPGRIRTHNLSRRAAADLRLRPRGHWELLLHLLNENTQRCKWQYLLNNFHCENTVLHSAICINLGKTGSVSKVKVKCTLVQALTLCTGRTAHRGCRGIALPFHDHDIRRCVVSVTPRPLFTPGKTRYPLYRRLGGPHGRSGQVRKISPPTGFDPRTVQPVASRYTDYATRPTMSRERSE